MVQSFLAGEFISCRFSKSSRKWNCRSSPGNQPQCFTAFTIGKLHLLPNPQLPGSNVSLLFLAVIWWLTWSQLANEGHKPYCKQKVIQAFLTLDGANGKNDQFGASSKAMPCVTHPSFRRGGIADQSRHCTGSWLGKSRISCYLQNVQLH